MARLCKSCGKYYNGDYCDKCGYGKPAGVARSVKKYRKAAKRKPERMQTAEDKKLYAKWAKEEREESRTRVKDPKSRQHFLIVVAIAAAAVVFLALYQSGSLFSNTREEVVEQYFSSIAEGDYDRFVKCFPTEIKRDYDNDRLAAGLSKEDYMKELYRQLDEDYGEGYSYSLEYGNVKELSADDYDMEDYRAQYGSAPRLSEVCEMVINVEFRGTKGSDKAKLYLYLGRTGSYWRIFGMTEDLGTQTEDGSPTDGDLPPVTREDD